MDTENWILHFQPFRTRTEVRNSLAGTLVGLMDPGQGPVTYPTEIAALPTGNDREVMESYLLVKTFCERKKGAERRSVAAAMGDNVRALFARALDRMKELPPEPVKLMPIAAVTQVRRA